MVAASQWHSEKVFNTALYVIPSGASLKKKKKKKNNNNNNNFHIITIEYSMMLGGRDPYMALENPGLW